MSKLYENQFGAGAEDFVVDEPTEIRVRSLFQEVENGEMVKDTIDNAMQEANMSSNYAEVERNLHNMDVIGMERLLQMRFSRGSVVSNESASMGAMVGIGGALLLILGILAKYFGWISFFSATQGKNAEEAREKAKEEVRVLKEKMKAKLNTLKNTQNPDASNEVREWIKYLEKTVTNHTHSLLAKRIIEKKIDYDTPNAIRDGIIDANKSTRQLLKDVEHVMEDVIKLADRYGSGDMTVLDNEAEQYLAKLHNFFTERETIVESILFSKGYSSCRKLLSDNLASLFKTDYSRSSLIEVGKGFAASLRRDKVSLTCRSEAVITVETLAKASIIGSDSASLKTMSHISSRLQSVGKELDAEMERMENLGKKFKDILQKKESHSNTGGSSLKSLANEVHMLVEAVTAIYRPNVEAAGLAASTAVAITDLSIAQMKAIEIQWFKEEVARMGLL